MANLPKRPTKSVEELLKEREAREAAFAAEQVARDEELVSALREEHKALEREERARRERYDQAQRAADIAKRAREERRRAEEAVYLEESRRLARLNGLDEAKFTDEPVPEAPPEEPPTPAPTPPQEEPKPEPAPAPTTVRTTVVVESKEASDEPLRLNKPLLRFISWLGIMLASWILGWTSLLRDDWPTWVNVIVFLTMTLAAAWLIVAVVASLYERRHSRR